MNQYQFEQIIRRTQNRYGKMKKGTEGNYAYFLFTIEGNMLRIHRQHPMANGRRAREAVLLALYKIEGNVTGEEKNVSAFEDDENILLREAILHAIDPQASEEGMAHFLAAGMDREKLNDKTFLEEMYTIPSICLLRLIESIDLWTRKRGSDGYFSFLEQSIGNQVSDEMKVCFSLPGSGS